MIDRGAVVRVKRQAELLALSRSRRARPTATGVGAGSALDAAARRAASGGPVLRRTQAGRAAAPRRARHRSQARGHAHAAHGDRGAVSSSAHEHFGPAGGPHYLYLLEHFAIEWPDQVWTSDITYVPMAHGFLYLMAIIDLASRKVLAWRLSNTLTADFCIAALEEALARFGPPEIFNTDKGSQFTSEEWLAPLKAAGAAISMDGKGRWIDNVFIERLWRSVKYEEIYLRGYTNGHEAQRSLSKYFAFYNARRLHETLGYATPDEVYFGALSASMPAAA